MPVDTSEQTVELHASAETVLETLRDVGSQEEWIPEINAAGVPCGPVLDLEQALNHPITEALDMVETVEHRELGPMKVLGQAVKVEGSEKGWLRRAAPMLGEHSVEVARESGLGDDVIQQLLTARVIADLQHVQHDPDVTIDAAQ